jgi:hypothetical protein
MYTTWTGHSSFYWSQSSVVGIPSMLWAGWCGVWILVGKKIFLLSKMSRLALGTTQPPIQRVPGLYHGGKTAGVWSWTLTSLMASWCEQEKPHILHPSITKPSVCLSLCWKANACWNLLHITLIKRNLTCCRCTVCSNISVFIEWNAGESNMHFIIKLKKM